MKHLFSLRASSIRDLLVALWGEALPPTPNPWLTTIVDTITADDDRGRERGLVVTGDELPLDALCALIDASPDRHAALQHLPSGLRQQLGEDPRWDASWSQLDEHSEQTWHPDH